MTIRRSFEILELQQGATLDDARQAYKDIATVWHPDRFTANPRLKHKAEQKLKEVNLAYETLKAFFQAGATSNGTWKQEGDHKPPRRHHENDSNGAQPPKGRSRTEIAAELGTALILGLCSCVAARLHHFADKNR
jgi:curved DNA-binding protein CbpA